MMDWEAHNIKLQNGNLVLIKAKKGFLMCGYLNIETAEKLGDAAGVVRGVKDPDEALEAKIVAVTKKARELGVTEGMTGRAALEKMS
jgi:uncharacterized protein YunC (DUF1805 family)